MTQQIDPESLDWNGDHAASGWRSRVLVGEGFFEDGKRFELIAYDDGDWEVRGPPIGHAVASGTEPTAEKARARCVAVWQALT